MLKRTTLLLVYFLTGYVYGQNIRSSPSCGQKEITEQLFKKYPQLKKRNDQIELLLAAYKRQPGSKRNTLGESIVTLPVVVHIIHNNGPENISDARVMQGIQHLNEAFANAAYYNTANGINTQVQFCMAQRDPAGNPTNGVTRNVSSFTNMGGSEYYSDDLDVKDLNRWNPDHYINIWLVNSIPGDVVGYAYLPSAAGTNVDGIVMEAAYFGSSGANDVVIIHEIGHYLGLYHTFEGGCTNNDCINDGDKVCDTPPDQSTANVTCNINMNTCTTDMLSGFNSDMNDLKEDFMDYGNFDCIKVFTAGQSERMNWFIQNVRYSLLNSKACMPPCNAPVTANFLSSAKNVLAGTPVNFSNKSVNANSFKWYVDGALKSSSVNYSTSFTTAGMHIVKLVGQSNNSLCDDDEKLDTIYVTCSVKAGFNVPAGVITENKVAGFINTSVNASAYAWKVDGLIKSSSVNFNYSFPAPGIYTITLIASGNICSDSISKKVSVYDSNGVIPPEQCLQTTFQKKYLDNTRDIWDFRPLKDSGYIMCGLYSIPFTDSYEGAFVSKLNRNGSVVWSKQILENAWARLYKIKETRDENFIGTGRFYESHSNTLITKTLLLKLDAKGELLWTKKFGISGSNGENGLDVTETKDGGYAFCGSDNDNDWNTANWLVAKTDADGNIVWSKKFDNGAYERAYGIIANEDTLVVCGIRTISTGPRSEIVVMKLNAKDGSIIQSRSFAVANRSVETTSIFKIPGGYMASAHSIADGFYYADMDPEVLQLDENLNLVKAGKINADIFASVHAGIAPTPDGGFIAMQEGPNWSITKDTTKLFVYKINSQWQLEWTRQYPLPTDEGSLDFAVNGIYPTTDNGYAFAETVYNPVENTEHVLVIKTDDKGNTPGCMADTFHADFITPVVSANNFIWSSTGNVVFDDPADPAIKNPDVKDAATTEEQRCSTSLCDSLRITGKDSICNMQEAITYIASRNAACSSPVEWITDTAYVNIIAKTDSSIKVKFIKKGNTKLSARIITSCRILQDDINVYITNAPATLDLGPDIQLCTSSTVRLSAGSGFKSYKWNDGSVDSTLTAYITGRYYVTTEDFCHNYFSDTINITQAPTVTLDLPNDLNRCDNDSVTIPAPPGFQKYIWTPDYNINTTSGNVVKVWPGTDTTYTLTVQVSDACTAVDTVYIRLLQSLPVSIGNDTSFCAGDSVVLKAPPGFAKYMWQDGSTDQTLTAKTKGVYSLQALNNNGCFSKDSMEIKNVYPLPAIDLGKDGMVCSNADNILSAGSGYISYQWQDGSTQSFIYVNGPGKYWATVTGDNGCVNSDTITITGFIPEPKGFLSSSMKICDHAKTQIKPAGAWQSYLWNDNSTLPYLTISSPGTYWLEVTDFNGCKGRDTMNVLLDEECKNVIYFPSAFTPNSDGKNDYFKPTAIAPLEVYRLVIFNRWGQKIFQSNDIAQGWDGTYKGTIPGTETYIWQVVYKFYDEPEKTEKGTVVLIK